MLGRHLRVGLAAGLLTAGCTGSEPVSTPPTTPPPTATPVAAPAVGACHRLAYVDAVAPTTQSPGISCDQKHTAETFHVGRLDTLVDGHLVAVDSDRVRRQVAKACPARLSSYVGGEVDDLRLSMLRAVWFTPTVADSDEGANWFRCDVIDVAGDQRLATLTGSLKGVLDSDRADEVAMCGTDGPDAADFRRLPCGRDHAWRAIAVVPLDGKSYPGEEAARDAGQQTCQQAGQDVASDALDYQWGYEWPTAEQWAAGQTYGLCWAPDQATN
ncbi:septum formation family protein [Nocardioides sp.]|uniref:septum formation family protein n=1 Tax=Nocardioides sp. TaxID=35761 RepID=UPI0039E390E4